MCGGFFCGCVGQDQARAQAELLRRQEELEKKAAELDRRERELQTHGGAGLSHTSSTASPLVSLNWFNVKFMVVFSKSG